MRPLLRLPATLFVYEYLAGGGLLDGRAPAALLEEGRAMLEAFLADLCSLPGLETATLLDGRLPRGALPGRVVAVARPAERRRRFRELARECSGSVVIAPETGGLLARCAREVLEAGGRLLGTPPPALERTGDKLALSAHLLKHRVPALPAEPAREGKRWDRDMVIKPRRGAGSQDTFLLPAGQAVPPLRVESIATPFTPGTPASVLSLNGPCSTVFLLPARQRLSDDGRFRYLGGSAPLPPPLAARARRLAGAVRRALPELRGFAGADVILSAAGPEGDRVVEVNARLTTSYVALRHLARGGVARAWLAIWTAGAPGRPGWDRAAGPVEFSPGGEVTRARPSAGAAPP